MENISAIEETGPKLDQTPAGQHLFVSAADCDSQVDHRASERL